MSNASELPLSAGYADLDNQLSQRRAVGYVLPFQDNVLERQAVGYVTSQAENDASSNKLPKINLGLAASPIGPAKEIHRPLKRRNPVDELSEYPSDPTHKATRQLLVEGIGLTGIDANSVEFVDNGSYGAGDEVVRYLAQKGHKTIIASMYSFPNVSQWAQRHGLNYETVHSPSMDPADATANILGMRRDHLQGRIVYVDYPNNPFGQANPELLRAVIDHVSQNGGIPLIDLAFGEVLGDEYRSAMQYTLDRGGICLGSLSKTQGLPGLRSGYAIFAPKFTDDGYKGDERLVFGLNREAEFAYQELFRKDRAGQTLAQKQAERAARYNAQANAELYQGLTKLGLTVGNTDLRVPIQVILSNIPDFYDRLGRQGLIVESLRDYSVTLRRDVKGYHDSAVRMLTPKPGQVKEVLKRVKQALQ